MNAYCPDCETELDQTTGMCPACGWDPILAATRRSTEAEASMSLTEKYRGTQYDSRPQSLTMPGNGVSRGRAFVVMGLVAAVAIYGVVIAVMGPF